MEREGEIGICQQMRQKIAKGSLAVFDGLVEQFYSLKVQGQENLDSVRTIQKGFRQSEHGKPIPMIVYFNHIAGDDALVVFALLNRYFGELIGKPTLPVSDEYTHLRVHPSYAIGSFLAKHLAGYEVFKITQAYRSRGEEGEVLKDRSESQALELMKNLDRTFTEGGCLIIAPEGHRSPDNSLQPAEESIGVEVRKLISLIDKQKIPEAIILPIGIEYPGSPAKKFHLGSKKVQARLSVGSPLLATEMKSNIDLFSRRMKLEGIKERVLITNYLMMALSNLLPKEMRGVYDKENPLFKPTLEGKAKLVQQSDGRVTIAVV